MKRASAITTAVLPVAGKGTRVMPLSLHQPKSMIGIADRPMIHYILQDLIDSGIKKIVMVIGPAQKSFFQKYWGYLVSTEPSAAKVSLKFIIQPKPLGNGDAILRTEKEIGEEPFLLCFGDDLLIAQPSPTATLANIFAKNQKMVVTLERLPLKEISRYGVVGLAPHAKTTHFITRVVEKPKIGEAPSNLSIIGRYVITPEIFPHLKMLSKTVKPGAELYLTDAFNSYLASGGSILGWEFNGKHFDGGSKIGILQAQVHFGLNHPDLGKDFKKYLKSIRM